MQETSYLELRIVVNVNDLIDESVLDTLVGRHEIVPIEILHDLLLRVAGEHGVHLANIIPDAHDLSGLDLDILGLSLCTTHGLMDHDTRVGKSQTLTTRSSRQNKGGHTSGQTEVDGDDLRLDVLHGIVDGESGNDTSSRTVDVQVDGLGAILTVQIQHHSDDLVGEFVIDLGPQKDDTLPVEAVVNVDPIGRL